MTRIQYRSSMKTCICCGAQKDALQFYAHPGMADGRLNKCKECCKKHARERRENKIDEIREYDRNRPNAEERAQKHREYKKTERGKLAASRGNAAWSKRNRKKRYAHGVVRRALVSGRLVRQDCQSCGSSQNIQAHHEDYDKPIDVEWLCSKCHAAHHKHLRHLERSGEISNC